MNRLPIASAGATWRHLRTLLAPSRRHLAGIACLLVGAALAGLVAPALLGHVVELVSTDGSLRSLLLAGAGIVAGGAVAAWLGALSSIAIARLTQRALATLREDVVDTVLHLPTQRVEEAGDGDVVSRVSGDVESVGAAASTILPAVTMALFTVVVTVAGLGALDWRFALAALLALPLQAWAVRRFRGRAPSVYRELREAEAERADAVLETVEGAGTVVALGTQQRHLDEIAGRSRRAIAIELRGIRYVADFYNALNLAELLGLAGVLVTGFLLVQAGAATIGAATTAALFFHRLFAPMSTLLGEVDDLAIAGAGLARLVGVLEARDGEPAELPDRGGSEAGGASEPAPAVVIDDVSFRYGDGPTVVRGVRLRLRAGETLAVVGASGAGKSTLGRLVAGTLAPGSGAVRIGADQAHELHRRRPGRVVLVDQHAHTFSGPLAADLRLVAPTASDAELLGALDRVGATWARDLPDDLATVVGADGVRLRADQKQQVALARVLLAEPAVVVLDEATANTPRADVATLDAALDALVAGRTALIIAHRLDQAVQADRIVVMAHGEVVQEGEPADLVATPGPFRTLWQAWSPVG